MEPRFQTSFIPKKPVESSPSKTFSSSSGGNVFGVSAALLLVITLLSCGGFYAYKQYLVNQVTKAEKDLAAAESAFQPEKIQEIINADGRISAARGLIQGHTAISFFLDYIGSIMVKNIRFSDFSLVNKKGNPTLSVMGESLSYNALEAQSKELEKSSYLSNIYFSDFGLSDKGLVTFKLQAEISSDAVSFAKNLNEAAVVPTPSTTSP